MEKRKSNSVTTVDFDIQSGLLAIEVLGVDSIIFDVRKIAGEEAYDRLTDLGKQGIGHGFEQKLRDRAAIEKDTKTGKSATPQEKFDAMKALADHLATGGTWAMKGGGIRPLDRASLYQAVATVRNRDAADVEALYRSKEDAVLRTLLAIDAIAAEYARLTARGNSDAGNALLAELDDVNEGGDSSEGGPEEVAAS